MTPAVSQDLVDVATVVGGFSAAVATLFAVFAVPTALWQAAQSRRIAYIDLFHSLKGEMFTSADDFLQRVERHYRGLKTPGRGEPSEFSEAKALIDIASAWDRYGSCVRHLLEAYNRCGGDVHVRHLEGVWQISHSLMFALETIFDAEQAPEDSEMGHFLECLQQSHDECVDICDDRRVAKGAEYYHSKRRKKADA